MKQAANEALSASVVIPTFNRKNFLIDAMRSALCQSFEGDIEVIVVDDGSNDGTRELLESLAIKSSQLKPIFHKKNKGVFEATLSGIHASVGDMVFLLDDDDIMHRSRIEVCASLFEQNEDISMIRHGIKVFDFKERKFCESSNVEVQHSIKYGSKRRIINLEKEDLPASAAVALNRRMSDLDSIIEAASDKEIMAKLSDSYQDTPVCYWSAFRGRGDVLWIPDILYYRRRHDDHSGTARSPERAMINAKRAYYTIYITQNLCGKSLTNHAERVLNTKLNYGALLCAMFSGDRYLSFRILIRFFFNEYAGFWTKMRTATRVIFYAITGVYFGLLFENNVRRFKSRLR